MAITFVRSKVEKGNQVASFDSGSAGGDRLLAVFWSQENEQDENCTYQTTGNPDVAMLPGQRVSNTDAAGNTTESFYLLEGSLHTGSCTMALDTGSSFYWAGHGYLFEGVDNAAPTLFLNDTHTSTDTTTVTGINASVGDLIVWCAGEGATTGLSSASDSAGNTYTTLDGVGAYPNSAGQYSGYTIVTSAMVSGTLTIVFSAATNRSSTNVMVFSPASAGGNTATVSATTGAATSSIAAAQSRSATVSSTTGSATASVAASQSRAAVVAATTGSAVSSITALAGAVSGVISAMTGEPSASFVAEQSRAATMGAITGEASASIIADQSRSAVVSASTGSVTASVAAEQRRAAVVGAATGAASASIFASSDNSLSAVIAATTGEAAAGIVAAQSRAAVVAATTGSPAASIVVEQSRAATMGAITGDASADVSAEQSRNAVLGAVTGEATASISAAVTAAAGRTAVVVATTGEATAGITATVPVTNATGARGSRVADAWRLEWKRRVEEEQRRPDTPKPEKRAEPKKRPISQRLPKMPREAQRAEADLLAEHIRQENEQRAVRRVARRRRDEVDALMILARMM